MSAVVDKSGRFRVTTPLSFFEKADAPEGEQRRFGGLVTTESVDRQGQVVLADGLNFSHFMDHGWFNDNHDAATAQAVGEPTSIRRVRRGEPLPDGTVAPANGHWAEGILYRGHPPADGIWSLSQAIKKNPAGRRKLGFSIEGKIKARSGAEGQVIAAADVFEVAITRCPVNTDTGMNILAKALNAVSMKLSNRSQPFGNTLSTHAEPDSDEKVKGFDPDAPVDEFDEQVASVLGEMRELSSEVDVALDLNDPYDTRQQPLDKADGLAVQSGQRPKEKKMNEEMVKALKEQVASLQAAFDQTPAGRKQALMQKSLHGPLSSDESQELVQYITGNEVQAPVTAFRSDALMKSAKIDATGYLSGITSAIEASLGKVSEQLVKSDARHSNVETALVKGMLDLGQLNSEFAKEIASLRKAMTEQSAQLEKYLAQPAHEPRAAAGVSSGASLGGAPAKTKEISKALILDGLTSMAKAGVSVLDCGLPLVDATALIAGTGAVQKGSETHQMLEMITRDVLAHRGQKE